MARQVINIGTAPNDGTGDPLRTAYTKCNDNFSELYSRLQSLPPPTPIGSVGDKAGWIAVGSDPTDSQSFSQYVSTITRWDTGYGENNCLAKRALMLENSSLAFFKSLQDLVFILKNPTENYIRHSSLVKSWQNSEALL